MAQRTRTNCAAVALSIAWAAIFAVHAYSQTKAPPSKKATIGPTLGVSVARGQVIYKDRCAICHFSESGARKIGPGLKGLYQRGKFADGGRVDDPTVEKRILNGGKDMPPFRPVLNATQVRDLIAYLKTLR